MKNAVPRAKAGVVRRENSGYMCTWDKTFWEEKDVEEGMKKEGSHRKEEYEETSRI